MPPCSPDARRLYVIACHVLWRELSYFASLSKHVYDFCYLPQGLHNTPDILRSELQKAIDEAPDECEAVLIGYGLCSNGIEGIVARDKPLVVVRGHDCITFLLGSKERYREYFDSHPGTYWYSPGWIDTNTQPGKDRYEMTLQHYIDTYGEENAQFLMEMEQAWMRNYSNAAYVDLGFGNTEAYRDYTKACAEYMQWQADILEGDSSLVVDFLEGRWDDDRFLVVQPRETIVPSHDETTVITTRKVD